MARAPASFATLPPEVRLLIYRQVYFSEVLPCVLPTNRDNKSSVPPLHLINRTVYQECLPLLYSSVAFRFMGTVQDLAWLRAVRRGEKWAWIRHVCFADWNFGGISVPTNRSNRMFSILNHCRSLTIEFGISMFQFGATRHDLHTIHGFEYAKADECPALDTRCTYHDQPRFLRDHSLARGIQYADIIVESLIEHFTSECPGRCRCHSGAERPMRPGSQVHLRWLYPQGRCAQCYSNVGRTG
ncbi:MAG: hypothetical protein OHK93_002318 [Ramalina farinacea]|uniref:Uncharacterized protein n=1 Tax=Ramalina farinacea TaxID=258253 RepID=A0AA43QRB2_9LECA|nr:hypothetical protein [Ramalina farinacea]